MKSEKHFNEKNKTEKDNRMLKSLLLKVFISLLGLLISLGIFAKRVNEYLTLKSNISLEINTQAKQLTDQATYLLNNQFTSILQISSSIASQLKQKAYTRQELAKLLKASPGDSQDIYAITIAFAPGQYQAGTRLFAPSYQLKRNRYELVQLEKQYDYTQIGRAHV